MIEHAAPATYTAENGQIISIQVLDGGECNDLSKVTVIESAGRTATLAIKRVGFSLAIENAGQGFTAGRLDVTFSGSGRCQPSAYAYSDVHASDDNTRTILTAYVTTTSDCVDLPAATVRGTVRDAIFHVIRDDHACRCARGYKGTPEWDPSTSSGWKDVSTACTKCTAGEYWVLNGATASCLSCPEGKYSGSVPQEGQWKQAFPLTCRLCPSGSFADETKLENCKKPLCSSNCENC